MPVASSIRLTLRVGGIQKGSTFQSLRRPCDSRCGSGFGLCYLIGPVPISCEIRNLKSAHGRFRRLPGVVRRCGLLSGAAPRTDILKLMTDDTFTARETLLVITGAAIALLLVAAGISFYKHDYL